MSLCVNIVVFTKKPENENHLIFSALMEKWRAQLILLFLHFDANLCDTFTRTGKNN